MILEFCKIFFFALIFFINSVSFSQNYWIRQNCPTDNLLIKCTFTDSLNGWVVGDSGVVLHTSNGGQNWILQYSQVDLSLVDLSFINSSTGWIIGRDLDAFTSYFFKTTNSGNNWQINSILDSSTYFNSVYFYNALTGFYGTVNGKIYKTTNSGSNWYEQGIDSSFINAFPINKISFYNSSFGLACGGTFDFAAMFWRTTNGGVNWKPDLIQYEPIYDFIFLSDQKIIASGGDYEYGSSISLTYNSGINWNFEFLEIFGVGRAIEARTPEELWMTLSIASNLAMSIDTGNTWIVMPSPDSSIIYDICFTDEYHGWIVGDSGAIYKYNTELIGVNDPVQRIPFAFNLKQNYPNPFNPVTNITIDLSSYKTNNLLLTQLIIYDCNGKEIEVLLNKKLNSGTYELNWNGANFPSGVYFYKLIIHSDGNTIIQDTKKMVLLK